MVIYVPVVATPSGNPPTTRLPAADPSPGYPPAGYVSPSRRGLRAVGLCPAGEYCARITSRGRALTHHATRRRRPAVILTLRPLRRPRRKAVTRSSIPSWASQPQKSRKGSPPRSARRSGGFFALPGCRRSRDCRSRRCLNESIANPRSPPCRGVCRRRPGRRPVTLPRRQSHRRRTRRPPGQSRGDSPVRFRGQS